jgi:hypothetical protein
MIEIAINLTLNKRYYRLNAEHIVCVHEINEDLIHVHIMDNDEKTLNSVCCKKATLDEIEKISSKMLYDLGYNGEIIEYDPYERWARYYLPESSDVKFPVGIHYFNSDSHASYNGKQTITSKDEYITAMEKHKENEDILVSLGEIHFDEIDDFIYRSNEYCECASYELFDLRDLLGELIPKLDQGLSKDFICQLYEASEMNKYLIDKVIELEGKLPLHLHLEYPNNEGRKADDKNCN